MEYGWRDRLLWGVWLFALAAMAGFLMESAESWWSLGYVQNRQGMLFGPFTPVYGAGALAFALCWPALKRRPWYQVFLTTALLGAGLEYLWSWGQEKLFGAVWWNYEHLPLHLGGRTSLMFALCWGGLGVLFLKGIYPVLRRGWITAPRRGRALVAVTLLVLLAGDALWSSAVFYRQAQRRQEVPALSPVALFLDEHYSDQELKSRFPSMRLVES